MNTKKSWVRKLALVVSLVLAVAMVGFGSVTARADNTAVTFTGTAAGNSTTSVLYLSTSGGTVAIKLDANTDFSQCRVIVSGMNLTVTCYHGSDSYWHASKVVDNASVSTSTGTTTTTTVGSSDISVAGTVASGTTYSTLYLSTSGGNMKIMIDSATDTSSCRLLTTGATVTVACYRGSDAVLHASRITASNATAKFNATVSTTNTITASGTVQAASTQDVLALQTSGGNMLILMDSTASIGTKVLVPGQTVTVTCGYGSDAYWHVISTSGAAPAAASAATMNSTTSSASVNGTSMQVFTGTATSASTTNILYLSTSGGTMAIKLDSSSDVSEARTLIPGNTYSVAVYRGSDAYLHAGKVSAAAATTSTATVNSASTITAAGTAISGTTCDTLYFSTAGGTMKIRLDTATKFNSMIVVGQSYTIVLGYGSDQMWHALTVTKIG